METRNRRVRQGIILLLLVGVWAWLWGSPVYLEAMGEPESAAWVGLYLMFTAIPVSLIGVIAFFSNGRFWSTTLGVLSAVHLVIGLGYFPR